MAINPNIALQVRGPELESPTNALAKVLQLQHYQDQSDAARFDAQLKRQTMEESASMNRLYAGAVKADGTLDRNALYTGAARGGLGSKIPGMQKQFLEVDEKQANINRADAAAKKDDYARSIQEMEHVSSVLSMAQDPQSYAVVRQVLSRMAPEDKREAFLAQFPEQFDPTFVQAQMARGQTLTQKLADQRAREQQAEVGRHNRAGEGIQIRGQDMVDSRTREEGAANRGVTMRGQNLVNQRAQESARIADERLGLERTREAREAGADRTSGGPVLGVPTPTVLPWQNQSNPKDANKVKSQEISRGAKEIEKDMDAARKAAATAARAARFIELNKEKATGGALDKVPGGQWAQSFGDKYSEMLSITSELAPAMREPGSGASSDMDVKMFKDATVSVEKPGKTNENIAKAIIARSQQAQEYADFRQTYLEQNGTLQGADRYWKDYVNKNPIFKPESKEYELNPKRKAWADHFKASDKPAAAPAPAPGGGLSAAEKAELEALRKQLGRK
jgi:hypothetical protein